MTSIQRVEKALGKALPHRKTFADAGDFAACRAAEDWLRKHDYAVGRMERGMPRGLMIGADDWDIQKWHNLRAHERRALDGVLVGDMRNGPVVVMLTAEPEASRG